MQSTGVCQAPPTEGGADFRVNQDALGEVAASLFRGRPLQSLPLKNAAENIDLDVGRTAVHKQLFMLLHL